MMLCLTLEPNVRVVPFPSMAISLFPAGLCAGDHTFVGLVMSTCVRSPVISLADNTHHILVFTLSLGHVLEARRRVYCHMLVVQQKPNSTIVCFHPPTHETTMLSSVDAPSTMPSDVLYMPLTATFAHLAPAGHQYWTGCLPWLPFACCRINWL